MNAYIFLQHYWWFVVSLLGALLVFLLFVQGGNSLLFCLGKTEEQKKMMINSTGRKWEFTFTTLVTFGGAFFASFPLFYSTSFGGAYWLWMIILFSFVLQAVSYEFQSKAGNLLGKTTYRTFLVINGVAGPVLLGGAVATFFTGSNFYINKGNIADAAMPVISQWANGWHGLDALLNPWNVVLGLAVFFLARILGALYFINNINEDDLVKRCRRALWGNTALFLVCCTPGNGRGVHGTLQVSDELPADAGSAACIPGWCGGCALGHYPHAVEAGIRQGYLVCRCRDGAYGIGTAACGRL